MPIDITMPALSPTMETGTLAKWLVKVGDSVKSGDLLAEIETDKATMEVESIDEGTVAELVVAAGTEGVPVGQVIMRLRGEGEAASAPLPTSREGLGAGPSPASAAQPVPPSPNPSLKEGGEQSAPQPVPPSPSPSLKEGGEQASPPPARQAASPTPPASGRGASESEGSLSIALDTALPAAAAAVAAEDFTAAMTALASLRAPVDAFFEAVMVNDPDPAIRARRLALLARFRDAVHTVADFSKIA